jgi:nicotinamide mononucleotide transporter
MDIIINYINNHINIIEILTSIIGILYVIFMIQEKYYAYIFSFIGSILLSLVYLNSKIYLQGLINLLYIFISIIGYFSWYSRKKKKNSYKISSLGFKNNFYLIFIFIIISLLFRFILVNFLSYSSIETAYLDSFLFIFSLFATYLQYKKIFENWIYWIIINSIYAYLCFNNQLYYIMILAIIYTILSIRGYIKWKIKLFITYK